MGAEDGVWVEGVFVAVEHDMCVLFDPDLDLGVAQGRITWTDRQGGGAARLHHQAEGHVGG